MMICLVYGVLGTPKRIAFLEDPTVLNQQVGLVAALTGLGYTVDISYKPFDFVALEGYDLIIVSRGVSSGDFISTEWNAITKPVFVLSTYAARDSKMKLIQGSNVSPADGSLIDPNMITNGVPQANADGSYDSVFNGVTIGGTFPYFKGMYCFLDYTLEEWKTDNNTGIPLVVLPVDASVGGGVVVMARWESGKEAYPGSGILAGRRSFMDIGTDEGTGLIFNMDNYTDVSLKLFLNEVEILLTPPEVVQKRIAFLHDPSTPVQQIGLEQALKDKGYTVDVSYTPFDFTTLATYDLIIVSRGVSSSNFTEYLKWNDLKVPIFILSTYAARDSKMRLINGQNVSPADGSTIDKNLITNAVPVANEDGTYDAIFNGVTTDGNAFEYFTWMYCYLDYTLANWAADANNGKPLAVLDNSASQGGAGSVVMARWEPGMEAYPGTGILAGRRSFMNLGTDDNAPLFNYDNYTASSLKLFMNEVENLTSTSTVGVKNLKTEAKLKVYPNPSLDGRFTIEMKGLKSWTANVQIYTIAGMLVYDKNFDSNRNISINSGLTKGMYLLIVSANGNKSSQKIVIN